MVENPPVWCSYHGHGKKSITENTQGTRGSLLDKIVSFCREQGIAESTFGRKAVNDGKFVARLRNGSRVTPETWEQVSAYVAEKGSGALLGHSEEALNLIPASERVEEHPVSSEPSQPSLNDRRENFRFFDNRQKYLLFINTCGEKDKVAQRVGQELKLVKPEPPAFRLFDAGFGDGTVLTRVLRQMHRRYPTMPLYVSGKEVSLEDVRLTLTKVPDRLFEHPSTVLVLTNMYYSEAPWLSPKSEESKADIVWKECALVGQTVHEFAEQIESLDPFLLENWQARHSPETGNPIYHHPTVLVIFREDQRFMMDSVIPRPGQQKADFDLVIASQPYRSRMSARFKVEKVIGPLARALRRGGRLLGIYSCGHDPGLEIVQRVWPGENPFPNNRHDILNALREDLGAEASDFIFSASSDDRAVFSYEMHALPSEISESIGTSTMFAAWNAAVYVAQIEDERLTNIMTQSSYIDATRDVLRACGGLWFNDETYVVTRKAGPSIAGVIDPLETARLQITPPAYCPLHRCLLGSCSVC